VEKRSDKTKNIAEAVLHDRMSSRVFQSLMSSDPKYLKSEPEEKLSC